ncbi:hypothetical protein GCK32_022235, partial [Trichostrongylus colubriformis]
EQVLSEIAWHPTPAEQRALQDMVTKLNTVDFGTIPLNSTVNDLHIEILYEGPKEASKEDAVKLFFDFEFDQPSVST